MSDMPWRPGGDAIPPEEIPQATPVPDDAGPEAAPPRLRVGRGIAEHVLCMVLAVGGVTLALLWYVMTTAVCLAKLDETPRAALMVAQGVGLLVPALGLIALARWTGFLPPLAARRGAGASVAAGVATFTFGTAVLAGVAWVSGVALLAPDALRAAQSQLELLYGPLFDVGSALDPFVILVTLSVVPAICEELLFRGFVQRVLRFRFGAGWSIAMTATLFSAFHFDWVGFPPRVIIGVALGIAYERTGSLRLSMFVHAAHNLMTMLVMPWDVSLALTVPLPHEALLGLALGVPGCLAAGVLWIRALRALPRSDSP